MQCALGPPSSHLLHLQPPHQGSPYAEYPVLPSLYHALAPTPMPGCPCIEHPGTLWFALTSDLTVLPWVLLCRDYQNCPSPCPSWLFRCPSRVFPARNTLGFHQLATTSASDALPESSQHRIHGSPWPIYCFISNHPARVPLCEMTWGIAAHSNLGSNCLPVCLHC